jgi:hypothetical protein
MFAPLDRHYDNGFGAVADSFRDAAEELVAGYHRVKINGHLPICYLYRHSIELYLKGLIIIIHKKFKLPYGSKPYSSEPEIPIGNGTPRTIYRIHDLGLLYRYVSNLFFENGLDKETGLVGVFNQDTDSKIREISEIDYGSQFFRYPMSKDGEHDAKKSVFKEKTLALENSAPIAVTKTVRLVGRPEQVFFHDDAFTAEKMSLLSDVAGKVSACHYALMIDSTI